MIELKDVTVSVGHAVLLAPVSASISPGDALVIRGRNGTGKSTLLKVLTGITSPTSGSALIGGDLVTSRDRRMSREVAAMIGLPPMAPDLTIADHVLLVATTWFDDPKAADGLAHDIVDELELAHLAARFPHELSSGQTQLFALALVLARPFDMLILDEPEQRLDPEHLDTVIRVLSTRRDRGVTLVIATHSERLADAIADHTLWLGEAA
ncbi:ABC transporter ATP-binding protein [Microbacterium laevaniformans]|uniref:ABC transporter ATP-binding protein n=1 Tax=Microbacterium laevaniformans TaxID=36807 RepID=A0A4S2CY06_9MICO|nr:ATP-binding cassette domain-containing protein [Microbacterium laevaniformans]TGY33481.1 ABC transporter ATP-binding protein [Microbacterium laevaniformans]